MEIVPGPERLQVTEVSDAPETVAENCCVAPPVRLELVGVMEIVSAAKVTVAEALSELTALLVAVMVALVGEVTVAGAV